MFRLKTGNHKFKIKNEIKTIRLFIHYFNQCLIPKIDQQKLVGYINYIENNKGGLGSLSIFEDGKEVYNRSFGQKKSISDSAFTVVVVSNKKNGF